MDSLSSSSSFTTRLLSIAPQAMASLTFFATIFSSTLVSSSRKSVLFWIFLLAIVGFFGLDFSSPTALLLLFATAAFRVSMTFLLFSSFLSLLEGCGDLLIKGLDGIIFLVDTVAGEVSFDISCFLPRWESLPKDLVEEIFFLTMFSLFFCSVLFDSSFKFLASFSFFSTLSLMLFPLFFRIASSFSFFNASFSFLNAFSFSSFSFFAAISFLIFSSLSFFKAASFSFFSSFSFSCLSLSVFSFSSLSFSTFFFLSIFSNLSFSFLSFSILSCSSLSFSLFPFSSLFSLSLFSFSSFFSFSCFSLSCFSFFCFSTRFFASFSFFSKFVMSGWFSLLSFLELFFFFSLPTLFLFCFRELEEQTGDFRQSNFFSFSNPLNILFCGVLPGKRSRVIVSFGFAGCHTNSAQMETKFAIGSHNSLPSTFIPDLNFPRWPDSSCQRERNSLTSLDSLDGLRTYMSSLPWPTLW